MAPMMETTISPLRRNHDRRRPQSRSLKATPPPVVVAPKPADDQMLKKAIEVLSANGKVKKRAA
jgi:hypothetical protein